MKHYLFTFLFAFLTVSAFAQVPPKPSEKAVVYDYAEMLTPEDKVAIELMGMKLESKHASRLVFISVETKGDMKGIEFIRAIYNSWEISNDGKEHYGIIVACKKELMAYGGGGFLLKCSNDLTLKIKDSFQELVDKTTMVPFAKTENQDPLKGSTALKDSYMYIAQAIIALDEEKKAIAKTDTPATDAATAIVVTQAIQQVTAKAQNAASTATTPEISTSSDFPTPMPENLQPESFDCLPGTKIPVKPPQMFFACDYARLLTKEDAAQVAAVGRQLEQKTGAELVFVSVPSRDDLPIDDFAHKLFNTWGLGKKEKDNGVLLLAVKDNLLAGKSGKIRIEVGYGLEGCLNDSKCGRVLDDITLPPFAAKQDLTVCSAALRDSYIFLAQEIATEYKTELGNIPKVTIPEKTVSTSDKIVKWIGWSICGILYGFIIIVCFLPDRWFKKGGRFYSSSNDNSSYSSRSSYRSSGSSRSRSSSFGGGRSGGGGASR